MKDKAKEIRDMVMDRVQSATKQLHGVEDEMQKIVKSVQDRLASSPVDGLKRIDDLLKAVAVTDFLEKLKAIEVVNKGGDQGRSRSAGRPGQEAREQEGPCGEEGPRGGEDRPRGGEDRPGEEARRQEGSGSKEGPGGEEGPGQEGCEEVEEPPEVPPPGAGPATCPEAGPVPAPRSAPLSWRWVAAASRPHHPSGHVRFAPVAHD
jgi:hypothetical protein